MNAEVGPSINTPRFQRTLLARVYFNSCWFVNVGHLFVISSNGGMTNQSAYEHMVNQSAYEHMANQCANEHMTIQTAYKHMVDQSAYDTWSIKVHMNT